jgi:hypothetical protein
MKKLLTALAGISMLATAAPSMAQHHGDWNRSRSGVELSFSIGNNGRQYIDPYQNNMHDRWRQNREWRTFQQYRYVPRCRGDDVAVRSPYNYNRYICVDRDDLYDSPHYRTYR